MFVLNRLGSVVRRAIGPARISRARTDLARKRQQRGVIGLPPSPPRAHLARLLPPLHYRCKNLTCSCPSQQYP